MNIPLEAPHPRPRPAMDWIRAAPRVRVQRTVNGHSLDCVVYLVGGADPWLLQYFNRSIRDVREG